jgi:hypothetical protein
MGSPALVTTSMPPLRRIFRTPAWQLALDFNREWTYFYVVTVRPTSPVTVNFVSAEEMDRSDREFA